MTPVRFVLSMVAVLTIMGTACSSGSSAPSIGIGSNGTGGVASQGATTASGGQSGTGGANGTGGAPSQGGQGGQGGSMGSGGTSQSGTGGVNGTGGAGGLGSGGAGAGGRLGSGGAGDGGASTGAGGTVPATGGSGALGGTTGSGSGGSSGGSGADAGAAQSAGCGKTRTLQNGTITIQSTRKYILRVPDGYDNSHPYRLVFSFAESGSSAQSVADRNYFTFATLDSKNTIFAAPDAVGGAGSWSTTDVAFTDAILAQLEGDLCIDKTRIFASGFSFGAAMSMALACTRADVFRAVAFFSGADLTGSCPTTLTTPIAYYASQASQDSGGMASSPMLGEVKQAQFAAVNGCTAEPASTTFPGSGQPHTCTIYKGCSAGHPTEYCVFNGPHGWQPVDPGQTTSWDPPEAWKFITQF